MLFWAIKWTVMSIVLIMVLHHLYIFFMDTLTVPMNKDFIHKPVEKYKEMLDTIHATPKSKDTQPLDNIMPRGSSLPTGLSTTTNTTSNGLDTTSMQNELQSFLNELKENKREHKDSPIFTGTLYQ
jgi:hypothetical protein